MSIIITTEKVNASNRFMHFIVFKASKILKISPYNLYIFYNIANCNTYICDK